MYIDTIIIGSGISGLTIAAGLDKPDFIILEARDRIGGRVFTNNKTQLDMGAAWIHGSIDNPLNKFLDYTSEMIVVSPTNPWVHSEDISIQYLNLNGKISELTRQTIAAKWREIVLKLSSIPNKTIAEAFNEISNTNDLCPYIDSFIYMLEVWCGGSVDNIPTSYLKSSVGDYPGSHCLFKNGTTTLIKSILSSSKYNIMEKVHFNKIVTNIIYDNKGVKIFTSDGYIYNCNKVCITVPPGPLKNIAFDPPLDRERLHALSQIKMGSYKKIQLEFDKNDVFWSNSPMLLTCENNKDKYTIWNNYMFLKNKPIIEAICPANLGWELAGKSDEEIADKIMTKLKTFYPLAPEPVS
jgi:monoamine oxidase